jgi:microsomal dipeptidase-like Zn-dependent dipeptidase
VRRTLTALGVVLAVLVTAVGVLGAVIEGRLNRVAGTPPLVPEDARAFARASFVVDLHADPLLWGRDLGARSTVGHIDLPRLRAGGGGLQVFGLVTSFPVRANIERTDPRWPDAVTLLALAHRWPLATVRSLKARALYQEGRLAALAEREGAGFVLVRTRADLERLLAAHARNPDVIGGLLGLEGTHALEGDPANLGALADAGLRMVGLAHFFDNEFAGSAHGIAKGGLTEKGRALVRDAERRGIVVDLAHSSPAAIADVLAMAEKPVVVSHTGVRATCDNPRNLTDDQIRAIARTGGVIGIGVWETAVCGLGTDAVARAMRHVVDLVGDTHVGLGTDFDGAVTAGFDASGIPALVPALRAAGLDDDAIRRVMGGNAVRLLREVLPASE